eukprot:13368582-Alexandrium_andersonii.AAC.1
MVGIRRKGRTAEGPRLGGRSGPAPPTPPATPRRGVGPKAALHRVAASRPRGGPEKPGWAPGKNQHQKLAWRTLRRRPLPGPSPSDSSTEAADGGGQRREGARANQLRAAQSSLQSMLLL